MYYYYQASYDLPQKKDAQTTKKEMERYTGIAMQAKSITNSKVVPTREDIINIYSRSLQIY